MGIPVKARWWVVTLVIIGALMLLSALALDRPNVVWDGQQPHCPLCRHVVSFYSTRCAACRGEFDWVAAAREDSPISHDSLSVLEAEWVHERVQALGVEAAASAVATRTGLSPAAATTFLQGLGWGNCGWCGGTKLDLAAPDLAQAGPCPCCFGTGESVACGGNRHVRLGDPSAHRALGTYLAGMDDLRQSLAAPAVRAAEARRLAEAFLTIHAGTQEAAQVWFWPDFGPSSAHAGRPRLAASAARGRLDDVVEALRERP